jgi:Integrase zinc binding domain
VILKIDSPKLTFWYESVPFVVLLSAITFRPSSYFGLACIAHFLRPLSFFTSLVPVQSMTDISNYGPVRRPSPSLPADNRKPYSRTGLKGVLGTLDLNSGDATTVPTTPDSPYYPFHVEAPQLEAPSQNRPNVPDGPRDIPGFPTYEQYQRIEEEYLSSLSERKQPKALISQSLFDKIYAVLQNGSEDRASTAQFRFWVRKMFVLAYPQTSFNHAAGQTPEPLVLHDKRPVAIKEQLYEVLCYCHAIARHGGRDKTCATLRLHYSWVPKELTAKFVKTCPTCTLKRSGNPDLLSQFSQAALPPYIAPVSEPALLSGRQNDTPPGLNFVGSPGCESTSSASFGPSIFTTPDLSVYPSPTLSAGSIGPMTPSPYLSSGLFGYPTVFDPGYNSLSSVAGWDPSPSPCIPGYAAAACVSAKQPEAQGLQLHLPTPRKSVRRVRNFSRGGGGEDGLLDSSIAVETATSLDERLTPCIIDANIDPALFMMDNLGYPPLPTLVGPVAMRTDNNNNDSTEDIDQSIQSVDADADEVEVRATDNTTTGTGTAGGGGGDGLPSPSSYLLNLTTTTWDTPTSSRSTRTQLPPPPPSASSPSYTASPSAACTAGLSFDNRDDSGDSNSSAHHRALLSSPQMMMNGVYSFDDDDGGVPPELLLPPSPPASASPRTRASPGAGATTTSTATPAPLGMDLDAAESMLCGDDGMNEAAETRAGEEAAAAHDSEDQEEEARWRRPEAWLVPSDSV